MPDSSQEEAHALLATQTWLELSAGEASRFGYSRLDPQAGVIVLLRGEEAMARAYDMVLAKSDRLNVWHKDGIVAVFQSSTRSEVQCTRRSRAALAILPKAPKTVYSSAFWATIGGVH